ncbi:hypothetical protein HGA88_06100 [Candidatus Roizmanbacteria bacterium]|nr:hypothetical protein [Candidatus Roizmanbacteria bacterium]
MRTILKTFLLSTLFLIAVQSVHAVKYDLVVPTDELVHGQNVQFTINVDTEGTSLTNLQIGLSYDKSVLQYVSITPGESISAGSVSVSETEAGKLVITGTHPTGFSGSGAFAVVTFQIIADAAGKTEICALYAPATTPTTAASTTTPTTVASLPRSGSSVGLGVFSMIGGFFLFTSFFLFAFAKNSNSGYIPERYHGRRRTSRNHGS